MALAHDVALTQGAPSPRLSSLKRSSARGKAKGFGSSGYLRGAKYGEGAGSAPRGAKTPEEPPKPRAGAVPTLDEAEARSATKTELLGAKAYTALRDVATLRAQELLGGVHRTTLHREIALLDGTVGFLAARLSSAHRELRESLAAQEAHRQRADAAQLASSASALEAQHLSHVTHAQKRTIDDLRENVAGAQVWARESEAVFVETLASIRYAAAEQLTVQGKRLRAWEEQLEQQRLEEQRMEAGPQAHGRPRHHGQVQQLDPHHQQQQQQPQPHHQPAQPGRPPSSKLASLIEEERSLVAAQAKLFSDAMDRSASFEVKLLSERLAAADKEIETSQRLDRSFADELENVGRGDHEAALSSVRAELGAARSRLGEQEETIRRMEDWMYVIDPAAELLLLNCC